MIANSKDIRTKWQIPDYQRETLAMIADGFTTKGIALARGVGVKAVEYHRKLLMNRTGLFNASQLTKLAIRLGLSKIDV